MRIAILGMGAMGSVYAGLLAAAGKVVLAMAVTYKPASSTVTGTRGS